MINQIFDILSFFKKKNSISLIILLIKIVQLNYPIKTLDRWFQILTGENFNNLSAGKLQGITTTSMLCRNPKILFFVGAIFNRTSQLENLVN